MKRIVLAVMLVSAAGLAAARDGFDGAKAGEERTMAGVRLCWCPPGTFLMGSPPDEPERRPNEDQVEVTLARGLWAGKYEVTQGDWTRVVGKLPGPLTAELPEDPDLHDARSSAQRNRDGTASRVRRGGAWTDDGWACRSAFRLRFEPERR